MKFLMTLILLSSIAEAGLSLKKRSEDNGFGLKKPHVEGELIVKIKPGMTSDFLRNLKDYNLTLKSSFAGGQNFVLKLHDGDREIYRVAEDLSQRVDVEYVEANQIFKALAAKPNDPDFSKQYALLNTGANGGTRGADIAATEAWSISKGSKDVLVSVIDTGVDYTHKDLKDNYWRNPGEVGLDKSGKDKSVNGIDDDNNGYVDDWGGWDFANNDNNPFDDNSHGTHCAGVVGAKGNNAIGISGINWDVSIVGIKFLDAEGSGTTENAVKSIDYSLVIGADISSNSWGGGDFSPSLKEALDRAKEVGQLFIAAAGNDGEDNDVVESYPANYDHVNLISVAATDNEDKLAYFSNYGAKKVHIAAPGVEIYSTVPGDKYRSMSGTSMAAPQVAGVAALIKATWPGAKAEVIKNRILKGSVPHQSLLGMTLTQGRLSAYNSIEEDQQAPSDAEEIKIDQVGMSFIKLSWAKSGDDGHEREASRYEVSLNFENGMGEDRRIIFPKAKTGDRVDIVLDGLPANAIGKVSIRALDNVGNESNWSSFTAFKTSPSRLVYENLANDLSDVKSNGTWGIEDVGGNFVFSDSPREEYKKNTNYTLQLRSFKISSPDVVLSFKTSFDIEKGYDFGHVEISTDEGKTWKVVKSYTATSNGWEAKKLYLYHSIGSSRSMLIRFRLESDISVTSNGWLIDQIQLESAAN